MKANNNQDIDQSLNKKGRIRKFIRKASISSAIILVILVVSGLIYTWYMGQNVAMSAIASPVTTTDDYVGIKVVKPAENVPESASIQSFSTPILSGSNAAITVRTKPDSICKISVIYNEIASVDSGLVDKTADEYGMVSWSW